MALLTIVPPAAEPVALADMKLFARVDAPDDDSLLLSLISAARHWCEVYTQRRFITRTMRLLMDFFPGYVDFKLAGQKVSSPFVSGANAVLVGIRYAILLPYPKVRRVVKFQYLDANGQTTTMVADTDFVLDLESQPARLMPPFGDMWPVARVVANAVSVDYVTGYGGPITVSMTQNSAALAGYEFAPTDVGSQISIPGAGASGSTLTTTVAAVDGNGNGTAAAAAATAVSDVQAYMGEPVPNEILTAIKLLANYWYANRLPDTNSVPRGVKALLGPYRDSRL